MTPDTSSTSYDTVLYPSETHSQTHPNRLAVIATLFGIEPAPIDRCRVLEIGCGNGSNLAPMAWALPNSEFTGIDLASRPITQGRRMIQDLGLSNIRLVQGDLTQMDEQWGKFDYIIAHGLYSWVPAEVRERLLWVCQRLLAEQGVAFVSYNALPGGHLRQMVSEMMRFHVRGCDQPEERVRQGVALARFVAEAQDTREEYRLWMKAELARILQHDAAHLYHDELSEVNEPFYFSQFMERAVANGLQYVGEADYSEMSDHTFAESVRNTLRELAPQRLLREQYLDFLKCRPFRQTLLCQAEAAVLAEPRAQKVTGFLISSPAACVEAADLRPGVSCAFETPKGARFETDLAAGKAALGALAAAWPLPMRFEEVMEQVGRRLKEAGSTAAESGVSQDDLAEFLLRLYGAGIVEFRTSLPPMTMVLSERPIASAVARWQAQRGEIVSSLLHSAVRMQDEVGRRMLGWLDGTRDRKALVEELFQWFKSNNAALANGNGEELRAELHLNLEKNLAKLARMGLLVDTTSARVLHNPL